MRVCDKRVITNEEFNIAYANEDNIKLINSFNKKFRTLSFEEITTCGMLALWRALQDHDPLQGKFTSSLYNFMRWECLKQIQENENMVKVWPYSESNKAFYQFNSDHIERNSDNRFKYLSGKHDKLNTVDKCVFVY